MNDIRAEIAVVGTGAGGAMVAQELACAGKKVVMIERGQDSAKFAGMEELDLARNLYQEAGRYPKTREGYSLLRGMNVGGSTELAVGHGVRCLEHEFLAFGIDLNEAFRQTENELGICDTPDGHIGPNARLLTDAARSMNMEITWWRKFIDFKKCTHCGRCVLTCPVGAKWSSSRVIDKLRTMDNVRLLTETKVKAVRIEQGRAMGVMCETAAGLLEVRADTTILCAGGLGTPVILQNSGIMAGRRLFLDVFRIVYGRSANFKAVPEPSMSTIFDENKDRGYVLTPYVDVTLMFQGIKGWFKDRPPYGIMVKIKDDAGGTVDKNGLVSKHLTEKDRSRLAEGVELAGKILHLSGVHPDDITVSEPAGGHPGGSAAIGDVVNPDLQCKNVRNLYLCDASVFPESPGRPPILTICALGKWLGKRLACKSAPGKRLYREASDAA